MWQENVLCFDKITGYVGEIGKTSIVVTRAVRGAGRFAAIRCVCIEVMSSVSWFVGAGVWWISWWQAVFEILIYLGHQSAVGGDACNDQQKIACNR